MTATNAITSTTPDNTHSRLVEELLRPLHPFYDMAAVLSVMNEGAKQNFEKLKAKKDADRARLMALPLTELQAMQAKRIAQAAAQEAHRIEAEKHRKAQAAEKEAKKEAEKFYNQASSAADFKHWATMDHWTLDEALALLLRKDPRVLTRAAMQRELAPEFSLQALVQTQRPKSEFLCRYVDLRQVAERAAILKALRLRPADVLLWAHQSGAVEPPPELVRAVVTRIQRATPIENKAGIAPQEAVPVKTDHPQPTPADAPFPLKRSALIKKHERAWPSIEGDLRHANENGLSTVAKADGHGLWFEEAALQWARQNGKLMEADAPSPHAAHAPFGRVHRMDG